MFLYMIEKTRIAPGIGPLKSSTAHPVTFCKTLTYWNISNNYLLINKFLYMIKKTRIRWQNLFVTLIISDEKFLSENKRQYFFEKQTHTQKGDGKGF